MNEENVNYPLTLGTRRDLRKNPTKAEAVLWSQLRNRKLGYKFQRQFPIKYFICDFCCRSKKLIIEIDGEIHNQPNNQEYDQERERILIHLGYKIIRFSNNDVLNNLNSILKTIQTQLVSPLP